MPGRNIVARTWQNDDDIMQHLQFKCCVKILTIFKFEPTTPKMSRHVARGWPNACDMLGPTMLRSFGQGFKFIFIVFLGKHIGELKNKESFYVAQMNQ